VEKNFEPNERLLYEEQKFFGAGMRQQNQFGI
jgi:hypothetical protein